MSHDSESRPREFINRGNYSTDTSGITTFFLGRLADPFIQYGFLAKDWGIPIITSLGGTTLPAGPPWITHTPFDRLGLSPYRSIMFAMSLGSVVKQNYHLSVIMQEKMTVAGGVKVALGNAVGNAINSLLFVCAQTSASVNGEHFPQTPLIVGSTMYVAGMLIELISEQQRHMWKSNGENKGKVYGGGLFGLARHINYFGYTLWRSGYALAAGGWLWSATVAALSWWQFTKVVIPAHEHYLEEKVCSSRLPDAWTTLLTLKL
jgi:protein-S-isoprenylcysteine O-methyltransferase Ste14